LPRSASLKTHFLRCFDSLVKYIYAYKVDIISIGNGTASKESEIFVADLIKNQSRKVSYIMTSEAGASVYSASKLASELFPELDVSLRSSVSIARRLQDPLAEIVKIDPKAIGVGQYQHDVDQNKLKTSLDLVVASCVNAVGVDLNTASKHLLTYVSGLGEQLAQNIVDYRAQKGAFSSRAELKDVPRLGPKAYEQAAGFLKIRNAKNPLDNSAVHPESYYIVKKMADNLGVTIENIIQDENLRKKIDIKTYIDRSCMSLVKIKRGYYFRNFTS